MDEINKIMENGESGGSLPDFMDASEAKTKALANNKILKLAISFINMQINDAINKGIFSIKGSDFTISSLLIKKIFVQNNEQLEQRIVLNDDISLPGVSGKLSFWHGLLLPCVKEYYEKKNYKFTTLPDYDFEISFA